MKYGQYTQKTMTASEVDMSKTKKTQTSRGGDDMARSLKCFENQPNINMVIPWIYEISQNMASSRDNSEEKDEVEEDLQCFLNQPNINMTIPWIYSIYKSVKSGGGSGGGGGESSALEWKDYTEEA